MEELEVLLCKIYEDNALGKLPDKRFEMLSNQYERESASLDQEIRILAESIDSYVSGSGSAKKFIALIDKYHDFDDLTAAIANELIDRIVVFNRDRKGSIQTTQRVDIYFSFIGRFEPPAEPIDPDDAAAMEEERRKIEEKKDRLHRNYLRRKEKGTYQAYERKYESVRKKRMEERKAQIKAWQNSMSITDYMEMRKATRSEEDMPEGVIGYDIEKIVGKNSVDTCIAYSEANCKSQ